MPISKIVQDSINGGVAGSGPAFSAYCGNNQSITNAVWTKAAFNTEVFDTANCYDPTTNYRFTPNIAGYYQINIANALSGSTNIGGFGCSVYKNGSAVQYFYRSANVLYSTTDCYPNGSFLVYLNGSTDYVEVYCYISATSPVITLSGNQSCFQAFLVRSA